VFATVVPQALERLPDEIRRRLDVSQQARPEDVETVRAAYATSGIRAEVAPFFADLAARLDEAHLFIGRAGASTIAEITCAGRPAILVPYPHAADDHQTANARALAAADAAILMPQGAFTADTLAPRLTALLGDPGSLARLADAAKAIGTADAADNLAVLVAGMTPARAARASDGGKNNSAQSNDRAHGLSNRARLSASGAGRAVSA
jgi:UDP-N-acetylglucosamine--N-acetylmuramyl-(pentapeptide) pyrophosphoryl-undecaprenol N-acetylglucosamine transferase